MKIETKYLDFPIVIYVVMLVGAFALSCNDKSSPSAASWETMAVSNTQSYVLFDQDSVGCYLIDDLQLEDDGRLNGLYVKESVYYSVQSMPEELSFIEIFATEAGGDYFLYNLEVLRREFVKAGCDPVLVATRKSPRKFKQFVGPRYGFSLTPGEAYVSGQ